MLDDLFLGHLNPYAQNYKGNPAVTAAMKEVTALENSLRAQLPEGEREKLDALSNAHSELGKILAMLAFRAGYYIASGIAHDLFEEYRQSDQEK